MKETNYVRVKPDVTEDLVDDSDEEDATINDDEGEIESPIKSAKDEGEAKTPILVNYLMIGRKCL